MAETSPVTTLIVLLYLAGVFALAWFAHRLLAQRSFLGEYFLGSRKLGSWAVAFTFAATSTSGGSFTGFPSLIYSFGWILALWISSYMIYSLCAMGVMGKRLNQVARKTGAITIPDVLRDRFESTTLGLFASFTIMFFTTANLVAQFKAGALIIEETFRLPEGWGYTTALLIFASVVVAYTVYGGFRAVVWTDMLQGVVMGVGVLILLPIILSVSGGVRAVNQRILEHPPLVVTSIPGPHNDLALLLARDLPKEQTPIGIEYVRASGSGLRPTASLQTKPDLDGPIIVVSLPVNARGEVETTALGVRRLLERDPRLRRIFERIEPAFDNDGSGRVDAMPLRRFLRGEEYLFGPGRQPTGAPFHPLGLAISYFFMWAITSMGQPGMMVRLMAFRDSRTLKRAILIVTVFFAAIYIPLVMIFTIARTLIPYLPQESSDKAMVLVATRVVAGLGLPFEILAALFLAATLAAIMSTVDSFLLLISSGIVRDVYQRTINPSVGSKTVTRASYAVTLAVGVVATTLAMRPIDYLQYIVIFTSSGFASSFLFPMLLGLYWRGMTRVGALWSMMGGFTIVLGLFLPVLAGRNEIHLLGFHPVIWGLAGSLILGIVASKLSGPAPEHLVQQYFYETKEPIENASDLSAT